MKEVSLSGRGAIRNFRGLAIEMRFRGTGFPCPSSAFRHCGAGSGGRGEISVRETRRAHASPTPLAQHAARARGPHAPILEPDSGADACGVRCARPPPRTCHVRGSIPLLCLNVNVAWCVRDQTRNSDRRRKETHHTTHTHRLPCDVHLAGGNRIQNGAACASRGASNRGASNRGASIVHLSCCSSVHFSSLYTDVV